MFHFYDNLFIISLNSALFINPFINNSPIDLIASARALLASASACLVRSFCISKSNSLSDFPVLEGAAGGVSLALGTVASGFLGFGGSETGSSGIASGSKP
jgi:hypothetical protein